MTIKVVFLGEVHWFDSLDQAFFWIKDQIGMTRLGTEFVVSMHLNSSEKDKR